MTFYIPKFANELGLSIDQSQRISWEFDRDDAAGDAIASIQEDGGTGTAPDIVPAGSEAHVKRQFTYENDAGKDAREIARIRIARQKGYLKPRQLVDHGTHVERVFDGDHPVQAMAQGVFCTVCHNAPKEPHLHKAQHKELARITGGRLPNGADPMDYCCVCGAKFGFKQKVAA